MIFYWLYMSSYILEIACFSVNGALTAQSAGAHRIELCENPAEGGTTPSYGTLRLIKKKINIPVFPIIRPRGGDFYYSDDEFNVIREDILLCKQLGFEGVVLGLLNKDGSIDVERTSDLVNIAYPMEVTFHRAFDRCINPLESLEKVIEAGCQRILTSGQFPSAIDGRFLIKDFVSQANDRIIVMPGSGVRSNNIIELAKTTNAVEFHASARKAVLTAMHFEVKTMNESLTYMGVEETEVINMQAALRSHFSEPTSL